jgi:hypothetical protein
MCSSFCWRFPVLLHLKFVSVKMNLVNCAELPELLLITNRNCELCQRASHLKEGTWYTFEELHIWMKINPTQIIGWRLWWRRISYIEKCEYFVSYSENTTQICFIYPVFPNISVCQRDCYTVRQLHSVTSTMCGSYTVPHLHSVTSTMCGSYTVWQLHSATSTQCDVYNVWQLLSETAIQCDSYTVRQLQDVNSTLCDCYTVWQVHSVTATQFDCYTV